MYFSNTTFGVEEVVIIVKISVFLFLKILFSGIVVNNSEQEVMIR